MRHSNYICQIAYQPTRILAVLILLFFCKNVALAQSTLPFNLSYSGYGTLGYSWLNDGDAEYRTGVGIHGATDEGTIEMDTRAAIQFDAQFNPLLSGTLQLIARQNELGDAAAQVEWGFIRLLPVDRIELRLGRMSLPVYSLSDFREVGYANVILRPPEDVYSQIPLRRFDGADITFESLLLDNLVTVQLFGGSAREKIFDGLKPDAKAIIGFSTWLERGPVKARFNYTTTDMDIDSRTESIIRLRQGIDAVLAQTPALAPLLNPVRKDVSGERVGVSFVSLGLSAEFDRFFFDIEVASRRIDNWVVDVDSWSFVGGTTFGRFTPYGFISSNKDAQSDRRITLPADPALAPLQAGINRLYLPRSQNTVGAGIRFDFSEQIALKSQVEFVSREERGISFSRTTIDDDSDNGDDVIMWSFTLDFVF